MNAIQLLKEDHQAVRDRYSAYQEEGVRAVKRKTEIVTEVCGMLEAHASLEEQFFYPRMEKAAPDLVKEGKEEHQQVKKMIQELRKLEGKDDQAEDLYVMFNKMMEQVEHHVQEEEKELFPVAERDLKGKLDEMGEQMQQRKQEQEKAA